MIRLPFEAQPHTPQWVAARRGMLTASRMADACRYNKDGKQSAKRFNYMMDVVAERMTGVATTHYVTPAMTWGIEHEADAIRAFEAETGILVRKSGLVLHKHIEHFAATPDGFIVVNTDCASVIPIEVKCPTTQNFIEWRLSGEIPEDYRLQMLAQLACCTHHTLAPMRNAIFICYDPRVLVGRNLFWRPLELADDTEIEETEAKAKVFLNQAEEMFQKATEAE